METKKCPEHISTGVTPKDEECHSHGGDTHLHIDTLIGLDEYVEELFVKTSELSRSWQS